MITNTLYRISENILAICDDHLLIDYVAQGSLDQIDENVAFTGRTAWLIHNDSSLEEGAVFHNFNLILLDVELPDRSNEDQIQSDMLQVGIDIVGKLNIVPINKAWIDLTNVTITPFVERFKDYVAGVTVAFSVKALENFDVCSDTFAGSYIPTSNGQFILQPTTYLTCTTLQECPAFIAVSQSAGGAQTPTGSLLVTASAQVGSNVITFTKGNGDTFNVTVATGSLSGFVPYQGATADVNLGTFALTGSAIQLSGSTTGGKLSWNDTDGTADLTLKGGNVTLQVGQELVQRVVNGSGGALLESQYQAVKIIGAQGQRLQVNLAQANNDANSTDTLGLVTETIPINQEGFVTTSGLVNEIDTTGALQGETWNDGDVLYLSPIIPGRLTNIKPVAPDHMVVMGYVVYKHQNHGKIFVKVDNGYEIDELHNVRIDTASLTSGDLLVRSGSVWVNTKQLTGSYAITGSLQATSFTGSLQGTATGLVGDLSRIATGSVTASVTPSQFTVTSGSSTELRVTGTGVTIGSAITDAHRVTGSLSITGSLSFTSINTGSLRDNGVPYVVYRLPAAVVIPSGSIVSGSIVNIPRSSVTAGQLIEVKMIGSTPNATAAANRAIQTRYGGPGNQVQSQAVVTTANQNSSFLSFARVTDTGVRYARTPVGSNNNGVTTANDVGGNIVLEYLIDPSNQTFTLEHITVTVF